MGGLAAFLKTLGPARLGAMGAVAAILIGFFAVLILRVSQPQMAPLFADLAFEDAGAAARELDKLAVRYEVKDDGRTILVPKAEIPKLRMRLAEAGLPAGGVVGYEIFDKSSALGATSFVQNINHLRALEGELARTIRTIDRVVAARVHLVLPERQLFNREAQQPSASIVLKVRGALEAQQIRAVQHLVASAVQGLKPERVSLVDETGRLLASGRGGDEILASAIEERAIAIERRLQAEIEDIVGRVVGPGRARVRVAAELERSRVTQTADNFDPDSRVVRSTQTRNENSQQQGPENQGVSVGNQLPGAGANADGRQSRELQAKAEETVNYEISRTTRTEVVEPGRLRKLSVAVLVDGLYGKDAGGAPVYQPRPQEQLDRITALVRSAIGFDEGRGDRVEVVNLRFADEPHVTSLGSSDEGWLAFGRNELLHLAEVAVLLVLSILVLLVVVRPLVRRIVTPESPPALPKPAEDEAAAATALPAAGAASAGALPLPEGAMRTAEMMQAAEIAGRVHADTVQKLGELVKTNPNEAVGIVRQWMQEPA